MRQQLGRNLPQHHGDVAALLEDRDAEPGQLAKGEAKVRPAHGLQLLLAAVGRDALHQRHGVGRLEHLGLELHHVAVVTDHGRLADGDVQIARALPDHGMQQLVDQTAFRSSATNSSSCLVSSRTNRPVGSWPAEPTRACEFPPPRKPHPDGGCRSAVPLAAAHLKRSLAHVDGPHGRLDDYSTSPCQPPKSQPAREVVSLHWACPASRPRETSRQPTLLCLRPIPGADYIRSNVALPVVAIISARSRRRCRPLRRRTATNGSRLSCLDSLCHAEDLFDRRRAVEHLADAVVVKCCHALR